MSEINTKLIRALRSINTIDTKSIALEQDDAEKRILEIRKEAKGDISVVMDTILINDKRSLEIFNYEMEKWCKNIDPNYKYRAVNYSNVINDLPEDTVDEATKRAFDTQAGATFGVAQSNTVMDMLIKTVGELSQIYKRIRKYNLLGAGNSSVIVNTVKTQAAWRTNQTADYVDNSNTIEAGNVQVNFVPTSVGVLRRVSFEYANKLAPFWMAEAAQLTMEEMFRCFDSAILNGTGSGATLPVGMNVNALVGTNSAPSGTQFQLGGDLFESLVNASTRIADLTKFGRNKQVIFMNSIFEGELIKIKIGLGNSDMSNLISIENGTVKKVSGIEVVICDEVIPTISGVSTATLGVPELYVWAETKPISFQEDDKVGFSSSTITMKVQAIADGKPALNTAFAKINSNNT